MFIIPPSLFITPAQESIQDKVERLKAQSDHNKYFQSRGYKRSPFMAAVKKESKK